jgi:hypothetical protein
MAGEDIVLSIGFDDSQFTQGVFRLRDELGKFTTSAKLGIDDFAAKAEASLARVRSAADATSRAFSQFGQRSEGLNLRTKELRSSMNLLFNALGAGGGVLTTLLFQMSHFINVVKALASSVGAAGGALAAGTLALVAYREEIASGVTALGNWVTAHNEAVAAMDRLKEKEIELARVRERNRKIDEGVDKWVRENAAGIDKQADVRRQLAGRAEAGLKGTDILSPERDKQVDAMRAMRELYDAGVRQEARQRNNDEIAEDERIRGIARNIALEIGIARPTFGSRFETELFGLRQRRDQEMGAVNDVPGFGISTSPASQFRFGRPDSPNIVIGEQKEEAKKQTKLLESIDDRFKDSVEKLIDALILRGSIGPTNGGLRP